MERDGAVVPDTFIGEQTLVANVKDRGLVVVTSCSHRGIVGICRHATRLAGVPKIHAVIGGFHLSGLSDERITQVVDAFRRFDIDYIVPQHCTGIEAIAALLYRLPGKVVVSSVGSTFTFAAPAASAEPSILQALRGAPGLEAAGQLRLEAAIDRAVVAALAQRLRQVLLIHQGVGGVVRVLVARRRSRGPS